MGYYGQNASCFDSAYTTDSAGDTCAWYAGNTEYCGNYDDSTFTASTDCCVCGGGTDVSGYSHVCDYYASDFCVDTTGGALDSTSDTCQYYESNPDACGSYDDWQFTASSMCCACGGGASYC